MQDCTPNSKVKPITPAEVRAKRETVIPSQVIDAFNELITENFDGRQAIVRQKDAIERIQQKLDISTASIFSRHYLDIEDIYSKTWTVDYDQPAYCETYAAFWTFSPKVRHSSQ